MRVAGVIAALSPEVEAMQEFERLRLTAVFHVRLLVIRTSLALGARPLPELSAVSHVISGLTVRVEAGMKELGERAALAA
jgi:hypothetical protein